MRLGHKQTEKRFFLIVQAGLKRNRNYTESVIILLPKETVPQCSPIKQSVLKRFASGINTKKRTKEFITRA